MYRDDIADMLEHLYSLVSNGGQYVNLRSPVEQRDGVAWCQPGDANLMWLMRDMLVREAGDTLLLCGSCPKAWLAAGESIGVTDLRTHFGKVSFKLTSGAKGKTIRGRFELKLKSKPKAIRLRLRHPSGATPASVTINGKPAACDGEWINLPANAKTIAVTY